MALVGYYSNSDSDAEAAPTAPTEPAPAPDTSARQSKRPMKRVVDKTNPGRIRVTLGGDGSGEGSTGGEQNTDVPPAKRARIGGGGGAFGGFNSLLPAPKRLSGSAQSSGGGAGFKLGGGLKTGAAPSFSRDTSAPVPTRAEDRPSESAVKETTPSSGQSMKATVEDDNDNSTITGPSPDDIAIIGSNTMFRPLTIGTKKKTKKARSAAEILAAQIARGKAAAVAAAPAKVTSKVMTDVVSTPGTSADTAVMAEAEVKPAPVLPKKPAISLFSLPTKDIGADPHESEDEEESGPAQGECLVQAQEVDQPGEQQQQQQQQSLDAIAQDLNLSKAARRQLFGRTGHDDRADIVHFDTQEQYHSNEQLRAAGETVQHNPLKAVRPGKHSLKQLVSAATSQKDALEEHFAAGRKNRKDAGARYGW